MDYNLKVGEVMIVSFANNSMTILSELVRQFGLGELSYDELWDELDGAFMSESYISDVSVGGGI